MATKKTEKTNTTKKVEKAVKETTSKIKTAVKSAVKTVAKKANCQTCGKGREGPGQGSG